MQSSSNVVFIDAVMLSLNEAKDADGFLLLERTDEPITEGLKTYYVGAAARLMDFFRKAELDQDGNPLFSDKFLCEEQ